MARPNCVFPRAIASQLIEVSTGLPPSLSGRLRVDSPRLRTVICRFLLTAALLIVEKHTGAPTMLRAWRPTTHLCRVPDQAHWHDVVVEGDDQLDARLALVLARWRTWASMAIRTPVLRH